MSLSPHCLFLLPLNMWKMKSSLSNAFSLEVFASGLKLARAKTWKVTRRVGVGTASTPWSSGKTASSLNYSKIGSWNSRKPTGLTNCKSRGSNRILGTISFVGFCGQSLQLYKRVSPSVGQSLGSEGVVTASKGVMIASEKILGKGERNNMKF